MIRRTCESKRDRSLVAKVTKTATAVVMAAFLSGCSLFSSDPTSEATTAVANDKESTAATVEAVPKTEPTTEAVPKTEPSTEPVITDEVVEIHDLVLDLAIHDALGKPYTSELHASELAGIKKLRIHTGYSSGVWSLSYRRGFDVLNVDLLEIGYLENLEELVIENSVSDQVYGFDGLKECKNLKSLSMYYELEGPKNVPIQTRHGENELLEVIGSCKNLKTLDLRVTQPAAFLERIHAIAPDIDIVQYGDYKDYGLATSDTGLDWRRYTYSEGEIDPEYQNHVDTYYDGKLRVYKCEGFSEGDKAYLKAHPYVSSLWITGGETDIAALTDLTQLTSLTISGYNPNGLEEHRSKVQNVEQLEKMENLVSLSLFAAELDADLSFVDVLPKLQMLNLYDLTFSDPENEKAVGSFLADTECFSKIRYLGIDRVVLLGNCEDIEAFLGYCDKLKGLYSFTLYDAGFYGSVVNNIISRLSEVRYLQLENNNEYCLKMSYCQELKNLRYLYVSAQNLSTKVGWDEFHGLPELYYVNVASADSFEHPEECKNIRILFNPMYIGVLNKNQTDETFRAADFSEIASLPYLSYFGYGVGAADYARGDDYYYLSGLKAMDENNVVFDFSRMKYREDLAPWEITKNRLK